MYWVIYFVNCITEMMKMGSEVYAESGGRRRKTGGIESEW